MNIPPAISRRHCGSTLMEAVIAIGVLAVAVPMVFGVLAESGRSGFAAQAETRSTWIIPLCVDEIRASREGRSQYFTPTAAGQTIPPSGDIWALAFTVDGRPLGALSRPRYESGVRDLGGESVRYIARIRSVSVESGPDGSPLSSIVISLEYPAGQKATKRTKIDFHTHVP